MLRHPRKEDAKTSCFEDEKALLVRRWGDDDQVFILYNFGGGIFSGALEVPKGTWEKVIDSSAREWGGTGSSAPEQARHHKGELSLGIAPFSLVLYKMCKERK